MEDKLPCLIVGGGVAGLGAAWALHTAGQRVCVLEADTSHLGGHAHTVDLRIPSLGTLPVDIGFIVYNERAYPNLVAWFKELGVETETSDMSFSVSVPLDSAVGSRLEWSSDSLWTLFGDRRNLLRLGFYRMLRDLLRFHREALETLEMSTTTQTLGEFLSSRGYSEAFREWYLAPMVAAIWSTSPHEALTFPARSIFAFFRNHGFLQIFRRPQWRTVRGRSRAYVERVQQTLMSPSPVNGVISEVRLGARVERVLERQGNGSVVLQLADGQVIHGATVVFATHADETLRLLGDLATSEESAFLSAFQYMENEVVIHRDERFMPQRRALWSSWNFVPQPLGSAASTEAAESKVQVTYYLNRLQNLSNEIPPIFETLNPAIPPREELVLARFRLAHPMLTSKAVLAQEQFKENLPRVGDKRDIFFAGAYCGYGFHEDALVAGLDVAQRIIGRPVALRPAMTSTSLLVTDKQRDDHKSALPPARFSLRGSAGRAVHLGMLRYLQRAIRYGSLVVVMPDGTEYVCGTLKVAESAHPHVHRLLAAYGLLEQPVRLHIRRYDFFWRVVTGADIGFAEAYMAGDCDVGGCTIRHGAAFNHSGTELVRLFKLFILNRDLGSLAAIELGPLARLGMQANTLLHLVWRRNTLGGSRRNIEAHYDLSNDLFATFLGNLWVYSCALWDRPDMDLDDAQRCKLLRIIEKLRLDEAESVLEIGCGWGALSIEIAKMFPRIEVLGITLSSEQLQYARAWAVRAGVADRVTFRLEDYRTLYQTLQREASTVRAQAQHREIRNGASSSTLSRVYQRGHPIFDRVVSIEMLEAVGHEFLGTFFATCDELLSPSGLLVVQVITTPEARYEAYRRSSDFINKHIFPGSCCPSLHALIHACATAAPGLSVIDIESIGVHYAPTLASWQQRFLENLQRVRQLGFSESFVRKFVYYLSYCEAGFATRTLDDLQIVFSRPGNVLSLGGEPSVTAVERYRRGGAHDPSTR
ncbi:hypothetical protein CCYA_CCYA05G1666 [Cyanidiococcus yangmingshanensis]|nr:hypothetical protein CCYA_CCYA05G1666 [Cyanidiococcus yangmingshanensis]